MVENLMERELNLLKEHLENAKEMKTAELLEMVENFKAAIAEEEDSFEVFLKAEKFAKDFEKNYRKRSEIFTQIKLLDCVETGKPFYY